MSNELGTYDGLAATISLNYFINPDQFRGGYWVDFDSPSVVQKDLRFRLAERFAVLLKVEGKALGGRWGGDDAGTDPFIVQIHGDGK